MKKYHIDDVLHIDIVLIGCPSSLRTWTSACCCWARRWTIPWRRKRRVSDPLQQFPENCRAYPWSMTNILMNVVKWKSQGYFHNRGMKSDVSVIRWIGQELEWKKKRSDGRCTVQEKRSDYCLLEGWWNSVRNTCWRRTQTYPTQQQRNWILYFLELRAKFMGSSGKSRTTHKTTHFYRCASCT